MHRPIHTAALLACLVAATGCLSSGPPAPPVRWLDPTAAFAAPDTNGRARPVQLFAQPHLVQDIAVRTSDVEVVYDADHRWLLLPEEVVRRALLRAGAPLMGADAALRLELTTFELDRRGDRAAARVAGNVFGRRGPGKTAELVEVSVPAGDTSPEALTRAMGAAVQQLVGELFVAERR